MNWVYERVVRHRRVNYHIWSANDGGGTVYALTRTSALAPDHVPSYRSMEEVFWKTGVEVEPRSTVAERPAGPLSRAAVGICRSSDGWAEVDYGHRRGEVPRELYERKGYHPAFEDLKLSSYREPLPHPRQGRL